MANELVTLAQTLYAGDVHLAFQNVGNKLAAYTKPATVQGSTLFWPKLSAQAGTGQAGPNVGGVLTFVGGEHTQVSVTMTDRYATPLAIKEEDMQKFTTSVDYRSAYAANQIAQLGRQADEQIIAAFTSGKNATAYGAASTVPLTIEHIDKLREAFTLAHIPDDGQRVIFAHPSVLSQLTKFKEYASADYVGPENLPFKGVGTSGRRWQSFMWIEFSETPVDAVTLLSHNMAWHPSCMGHGVNMPPQTRITQENTMGGQFAIVTKQSMGAAAIDSTGIFDFTVDLNVAPSV